MFTYTVTAIVHKRALHANLGQISATVIPVSADESIVHTNFSTAIIWRSNHSPLKSNVWLHGLLATQPVRYDCQQLLNTPRHTASNRDPSHAGDCFFLMLVHLHLSCFFDAVHT
jgi:hypothetical protein